MKIFRISLHSLIVLLSLFLILDIRIGLNSKDLLVYVLVAYVLGVSLFSVTWSLILKSFPRLTGVAIVFGFLSFQFVFNKYYILNQNQVIELFIYCSGIMAAFFLISSIISNKNQLIYKKIDVRSFKAFYIANLLVGLFVAFGLLAFVYYIEKGKYTLYGARFIALILALSPFCSKNFIKYVILKYKDSPEFSNLGISIGQIGRLARIKNFVFLKDKIISSGIYQITESDFRSSVKVTYAIQLARMIAKEWDPRYAKLFVTDEFEKIEMKYQVVEKNENGITIIDDDATMFHLGNSFFVKDKIHKDDRANLFLLKNEIAIAKFKVNEKILQDKVEFLNQLDFFGKTVLFNSGFVEDLGHDYSIVFDRIYSKVNEIKQNELLKELEKNAPTALFTSKLQKVVPNSVCFYVTSNIDVKSEQNRIVIALQDMAKVPGMIQLAKKVHTLLKYALRISFVLQIILSGIAFFMPDKLTLILGLNLAFGIFFQIIPVLLKKIIDQLPSHPANLAQRYQAA